MEPTILKVPEPVVPIKVKRKYARKTKDESKNTLNVLDKIGSVFEPNKKRLKMEILQSEDKKSTTKSDSLLKKIEKVENMNEKCCEKKMSAIEIIQLEKLSATVAAGFCNALGTIFDMALKGNGHIRKEFNNDKALEFALSKEVVVLTALLSNRAKIMLCTGNDIGQGFVKARMMPPIIEVIPDNIENVGKENGGKESNKEIEGESFGYTGP